LAAFDLGAGASHGESLRGRLGRIQKFVAFRGACGKDDVLHLLVVELKGARYSGKPAAAVGLPGGAPLPGPPAARQPLDGGSLPQAEIWLRYVLLLSYQGEGVDAVAGRRGDVQGAEAFYKSAGLTKPFLGAPFAGEAAKTSPAFLRW